MREKARANVRASTCLVFLGFGFHDVNMDYLGLDKHVFEGEIDRRHIYATGFKLSDYRRGKVREMLTHFAFRDKFSVHELNVEPLKDEYIRLDDANCSDLIDHYGEEFFGQT